MFTVMHGVEVDLEPSVAQVVGPVDEVGDRVLQDQRHDDGHPDGEDDDCVDEAGHAQPLDELPVHDDNVPSNYVFRVGLKT
jgi:hypothetical protein